MRKAHGCACPPLTPFTFFLATTTNQGRKIRRKSDKIKKKIVEERKRKERDGQGTLCGKAPLLSSLGVLAWLGLASKHDAQREGFTYQPGERVTFGFCTAGGFLAWSLSFLSFFFFFFLFILLCIGGIARYTSGLVRGQMDGDAPVHSSCLGRPGFFSAITTMPPRILGIPHNSFVKCFWDTTCHTS